MATIAIHVESQPTEERAKLLFVARPGFRPTLLAIKGGMTAEAYARSSHFDLDRMEFGEAWVEPQGELGLFVWEGTWRPATRADLAMFGFPMPEGCEVAR
ncbi:hypothetical protein [Singulisphaera sp. PoT]|uniref:hypothetical protein n=1 Tax=Singulisphaera sp. PoT TaxID=3411797 RepID=UPI003BF53B81